MQGMLDDLNRRLAAAKQRFDTETLGLEGRAFWCSADEFPDEAMARHACGADWIVAVRTLKDAVAALSPSITDLIMRTGLPVLVPPANATPLQARRIVVGWSGTREASRAISDAMPLLTAADQVFLVTIPDEAADDSAHERLAEVCRRLQRRGCKVASESRPRGSDSVAEGLVRAAQGHGADLLVVGGYAHSRVQEWVMGGVTRDLVASCPVYVLFSH